MYMNMHIFMHRDVHTCTCTWFVTCNMTAVSGNLPLDAMNCSSSAVDGNPSIMKPVDLHVQYMYMQMIHVHFTCVHVPYLVGEMYNVQFGFQHLGWFNYPGDFLHSELCTCRCRIYHVYCLPIPGFVPSLLSYLGGLVHRPV